jgi:hypothetical protein
MAGYEYGADALATSQRVIANAMQQCDTSRLLSVVFDWLYGRRREGWISLQVCEHLGPIRQKRQRVSGDASSISFSEIIRKKFDFIARVVYIDRPRKIYESSRTVRRNAA